MLIPKGVQRGDGLGMEHENHDDDLYEQYEESNGYFRHLVFFSIVIAGAIFLVLFIKKLSEAELKGKKKALISLEERLRAKSPPVASLPKVAFDEEFVDKGPLSPPAIVAIKKRSLRPCDSDLNYRIGEIMHKDGQFDQLEEFYLSVKKECGEFLELRWLVFSGAEKQGDFKQAERIATALIDDFPDDKDYFVWRGSLYMRYHHKSKAIADFQAAMRLEPRLVDIPIKLATLFEKTGDHCRAHSTLDSYLALYPNLLNDENIVARSKRYLKFCGYKKTKVPL